MATSYHPRPRRGWLNDPNGMVRRGGLWHAFFQHNPAAARHEDIHWGHLSSPDLLSWREHPPAFGPLPGAPDAAGCWSGVALDLGERVAVFYTGCPVDATDTTVCVRYAADAALEAWSPPRVVAAQSDVPAVVGLREVRDPFLFVAEGRRWAVLGAGVHGPDGTTRPALLLWSCDDLEAWHFERVWLDADALGDTGAEIWECPQLLEVGGEWLLLLSVWAHGELVGVVQVRVGDLAADSGGVPVLRPGAVTPFDRGSACYAPQVAVDESGPWVLGWVKQGPVEGEGAVSGCLTLPRRPVVDGDRVTWVSDPRTAGLVGRRVATTTDATTPREVPQAAYLLVVETAVLARGDLEVALPAGSSAWLDDDVVEAFPPDGVPVTRRAVGPGAWVLRSGVLEVHEVSVTAQD